VDKSGGEIRFVSPASFGGMNNSFTNSQTLNTSEDFGGLISRKYERISISSIGPFLVSRTGDAG